MFFNTLHKKIHWLLILVYLSITYNPIKEPYILYPFAVNFLSTLFTRNMISYCLPNEASKSPAVQLFFTHIIIFLTVNNFSNSCLKKSALSALQNIYMAVSFFIILQHCLI